MTIGLSRRSFLKSAAATGAALSLGVRTTAAQEAARTVNVVGWNSPDHQEILLNAGKELGITVKYDVLPAAWNDVMQKITLWGQSGYDGVDILFADDLIGGLWGMNGWADDLSGLDVSSKVQGDLVDNIAALNSAAGGIYRQFFLLDAEPFYYNKKLVPTAPKTWDEMTTVAQSVTGGDVWGWRPLGGNGHAFNTVLLMLNQAGADLESLSDPETLAALQYMYDWVQTSKITPPSTVNEDNTTVEALAAAGKAAMWWSYGGSLKNVPSIDGSTLSIDDIGVARYPAGPASDIGLVHGWGFLSPKASANKAAAHELLNYLGQPEQVRNLVLKTNAPPPLKSLLADPEIQAKVPLIMANGGWENTIRGAKFREPIVNHRQVTQLWTMIDKLGAYILSGQKSPADAQAWAMSEYQTIKDEA
ncbi:MULTISPECIES: substrate-binding domain-containing protein [unclassified Devosia]|uniref:sugar ABC transporter substrate-binding protein n=1 Tax=unclassified Devosia TaxID=196773 RepID=UPI00086DCEAD|nr:MULTISPECIES: substrate-binding domain-containing protein [unclassified Devosia]MBN9362887.1 extracellular solute-binding protein [Devosia sp.]ODS88439.1 MAG: hypothetical protein ABS47_09955 [Devosia sp. SCN 66-27]OJX23586.1 MAG: hypothetical protein BGO83_01585 [Devosia sp. 66-14]